jgi:hypothetical protein
MGNIWTGQPWHDSHYRTAGTCSLKVNLDDTQNVKEKLSSSQMITPNVHHSGIIQPGDIVYAKFCVVI